LEVYSILSSSFDSNVHILLGDKTCLVDTGAGMDREITAEIERKLKGRKADLIINTHAHVDHVGGNGFFNSSKVYVHQLDAEEIRSGNLYGTYAFTSKKVPKNVDSTFKGGDEIDLGDVVLKVIHTPGHTPGSVCLLEEEKKYLFSGDTLFSDGAFGRVDFRGGSASDMVSSLKKLRGVEFKKLFPGHMRVVEDGKRHLEMAIRNAVNMYGEEGTE